MKFLELVDDANKAQLYKSVYEQKQRTVNFFYVGFKNQKCKSKNKLRLYLILVINNYKILILSLKYQW